MDERATSNPPRWARGGAGRRVGIYSPAGLATTATTAAAPSTAYPCSVYERQVTSQYFSQYRLSQYFTAHRAAPLRYSESIIHSAFCAARNEFLCCTIKCSPHCCLPNMMFVIVCQWPRMRASTAATRATCHVNNVQSNAERGLNKMHAKPTWRNAHRPKSRFIVC